MWVPLVEAGELSGPGVDHFLRRYLDPLFASVTPPTRVLLGCTHYPLLLPGIRALVPPAVELLTQGEIVAERLEDWLARHPERTRGSGRAGAAGSSTTDDPGWFAAQGERILGARLHGREGPPPGAMISQLGPFPVGRGRPTFFGGDHGYGKAGGRPRGHAGRRVPVRVSLP